VVCAIPARLSPPSHSLDTIVQLFTGNRCLGKILCLRGKGASGTQIHDHFNQAVPLLVLLYDLSNLLWQNIQQFLEIVCNRHVPTVTLLTIARRRGAMRSYDDLSWERENRQALRPARAIRVFPGERWHTHLLYSFPFALTARESVTVGHGHSYQKQHWKPEGGRRQETGDEEIFFWLLTLTLSSTTTLSPQPLSSPLSSPVALSLVRSIFVSTTG